MGPKWSQHETRKDPTWRQHVKTCIQGLKLMPRWLSEPIGYEGGIQIFKLRGRHTDHLGFPDPKLSVLETWLSNTKLQLLALFFEVPPKSGKVKKVQSLPEAWKHEKVSPLINYNAFQQKWAELKILFLRRSTAEHGGIVQHLLPAPQPPGQIVDGTGCTYSRRLEIMGRLSNE